MGKAIFKDVTGMMGDCTYGYELQLNGEELTVMELLERVANFKTNKWSGSMYIDNNKYEIKCGKIISNISDDILREKVIKATANGGWGRMDYNIYCE